MVDRLISDKMKKQRIDESRYSRPPAETNVTSMVCGRGVLDRLDFSEFGDFVVTTMDVPWAICEDRLNARPRSVLLADSMEKAVVEAQVAEAPKCQTVLAIGGGRAIDLGKYLAYKRNLRLVTVPTVLSVDAFVTPAAGLRENGRVVYLGERSPDPLIIDYDVLRTAPPELNIAGLGDLLSIHTAVYDWRLAAKRGKSEYLFSEEACVRATAVLDEVMEVGKAVRNQSDEGLQVIVDGYMRVNEICLPAGHYRVEEGSEHYLFYELEERTGRAFVHGPIIGLGIYVMSHLQGNAPERIIEFMNFVGLNFHPSGLGIDRTTLRKALLNLPHYVAQREDLWYTAIDEATMDEACVDGLLEGLEF